VTDQPGGEPEQRLPVPRPEAAPAPVERFTSPPSTRAVQLTPARAAQIVRQTSNARWVGFLAVIVVVLFVALYWFYELGAPLGLSQSRLEAEIDAQQVTAIERGYQIYQANCARCHGVQGLGPDDSPPGIGPALNRQDKLFLHLNEAYLHQILLVGGRLACGNAGSQMPVWSNEGSPPGPLNYVQIDEVIAFLRATNDRDYLVRDPELQEPVHDPITGEVKTFRPWRDPDYKPEPGATPYPACWVDELTGGGGGGTPAPSIDPGATTVSLEAVNFAFSPAALTVPAGEAFNMEFTNSDAAVPHNVEIFDAARAVVYKGEIFDGVATRTYQIPALTAGTYPFICTVHPNMTGNLTAH
jgi:plastocyanin/mono/diheme cytochrome c family protein